MMAKTGYTLDPRNARKHPERSKSAVEASLRELGAGRSIVVDREGVVIGGNAVYEQALKLGIPVREVETSGDELIVVRRVDLATDDPKRKALALADNQIATLAEWEQERLDELLAEVGDIDFGTMGFPSTEFDVEGIAAPELQDGDRSPFQQMTFTLHDEQVEVVKSAVEKAKHAGHGESAVNENSNGNALAAICGDYRG
jgi:hypothetical protein